jgi:hypothetical protein
VSNHDSEQIDENTMKQYEFITNKEVEIVMSLDEILQKKNTIFDQFLNLV